MIPLGGLLTRFPLLAFGLLALAVLAGLAGTLAPAFGLGSVGIGPNLDQWRALIAQPGIARSAGLSLSTGMGSTVLSLAIATLLVAALHGTRGFAALRRLLAPFLAVPHAAAALGLAFLVAPSGWIARAISPWATGWVTPPDLLILNDPAGLALMAGLIAKETPFLLLMTLSALPQADAGRRLAVAMTLGHSRTTGYLLAVFPAVYQQLRLPVAAVLAYAMSSVEMGMILGPGLPAPLAVRITQWTTDPDLAHRSLGAAAAILQLGLVLIAMSLWRGGEWLTGQLFRRVLRSGHRGRTADAVLRPLAIGLGAGIGLVLVLGLVGLCLWSVAGQWSFPAALPADLSLTVWRQAGAGLARTALWTIIIAVVAAFAALAVVIAVLQTEGRGGAGLRPAALLLLYVPLIVPQVAFLPGLQNLALLGGIDGTVAAVTMVHLVFVIPYTYLSLAPAWHAWNGRIGVAGAVLGAGAARIFWRLRLPMLLRPVLTAGAIGVAVSVGQYLPSLLIGGGRVPTLTTEAVALSSGGNRRLIGATALLQMAVPFIGFMVALAIPAIVFRNRRGMGETA